MRLRQVDFIRIVVFLLITAQADFVYPDFNTTVGLEFNGDIAPSNCILVSENTYSDVYGTADAKQAQLDDILSVDHEFSIREATMTDEDASTGRIGIEHAGFGHRKAYVSSPNEQCAVRLRMTPSRPDQKSSVWYADPIRILDGFETEFTFQISDQSRRCYEATDQHFSLKHFKNCIVHGGDGFAFVLQGDGRKTTAIGASGADLGYGGIQNSIAIEFDTWQNDDTADIYWDHISVHTNGVEAANGPGEGTRLSVPIRKDIADGAIHRVRIAYFTELKEEYMDAFTSSPNLQHYLKDLSEGRRLGTLVIYYDDGIDADEPCLAIPINLAVTLSLEQSSAFTGFTASTGRAWQKQDLLSWAFCLEPPCIDKFASSSSSFGLDHHSSSAKLAGTHTAGAYDAAHVYPDTNPWAARQVHFAQTRFTGLGSAYSHIPHTGNIRSTETDGAR